MNLEEIIKETKAYFCLECGVCTGSCPISRVNPQYSPRLMVEKALFEFEHELTMDKDLWACFTCGACSSRCPSLVDYNKFIKEMRAIAKGAGNEGVYTHGEILQSIVKLQMKIKSQIPNPKSQILIPNSEFRIPKSKISWITDDLKVSDEGEYLYFVGCLPYFSIVFRDINVDSLDIAKSSIRIMNIMGIIPVISSDEKCCGHDLYWSGSIEDFKKLASHNLHMIRACGAKKVIFSCPEGYYTFKCLYPKYFGEPEFEAVYITELIHGHIKNNGINFRQIRDKITYQDPCRLGRMSGIYESPREILKAIPGIEFSEMERNRANSLCCGSSGWISCTMCNKQVQIERLKDAQRVANTLITACPKCQIHLSCALKDSKNDIGIQIKDVTKLIAEAMAS